MALGFDKKKLRKEGLRSQFIEVRNALSSADISSRSLKVQKRFLGLSSYSEADTLMFYVSVDNEVATGEVIKRAFDDGKRVVLPIVRDEKIIPVQLDEPDNLIKGAFGIPEPEGKKIIDMNEIDIIVVPLVSFDEECDRLGRGLGFYDRFLKGFKALKVGFGFDCQKAENIPSEDQDIRLDRIVTESRVIEAKK